MTSSPAAAPQITRERRQLLGRPLARYVCGCGRYCGAWYRADTAAGEPEATNDFAGHLADAHPEHYGRCERCGQPTDHFRADTPHGSLWLCQTHTPGITPQLAAAAAAGGAT